MIAYIKAWQIVLMEEAIKHGIEAFHFNTYIISILVIFYLQMNYKLPIINHINSLTFNQISYAMNQDLSKYVRGFFQFYGKTFEQKTHIISVHIGKWQQINSTEQKKFTPEQERLDANFRLL